MINALNGLPGGFVGRESERTAALRVQPNTRGSYMAYIGTRGLVRKVLLKFERGMCGLRCSSSADNDRLWSPAGPAPAEKWEFEEDTGA